MTELLAIARHRTALVRHELSRPLRLAITDGVLAEGVTVLDFGCGRGGDVRLLARQGFDSVGWDPVHAPAGSRRASDIVNIGYVVNVIEDAAERADTLRQAWDLTGQVLIVSARLRDEISDLSGATIPFQDGLVTQIGTFQKFFDQQELRTWIEQTLGTSEVAAAGPGVFYVFRAPAHRAGFLASRFRRISAPAPRLRAGEQAFAEHRTVLEPLIAFLNARGRLPADIELPDRGEAIARALGSIGQAFRIVQSVSEPGAWNCIREARSQDLLVFLALSRFDGRPRLFSLPLDLQRDTKAFFGTYARACAQADQLLFSLGSTEHLDAACRAAPFGKIMPEALYVHAAAMPELPILLRLYEGCARSYIGTVADATVVKLRLGEAKVSYLSYPDFEKDPHPTLAASISVDLRTFRVKQRRYDARSNPPVLHRKELFVSPHDPRRTKYTRLTAVEEAKGLFDTPAVIGTRRGWQEVLKARGLALKGHRLVTNTRAEQ